MAQTGMDIEVVRGIGTGLGTASNDLEGVMTRIQGLLQQASSNWFGPDAQQFSNLWSGQYAGQLRKIITEIDDLGKKATANAAEQERISNAL